MTAMRQIKHIATQSALLVLLAILAARLLAPVLPDVVWGEILAILVVSCSFLWRIAGCIELDDEIDDDIFYW